MKFRFLIATAALSLSASALAADNAEATFKKNCGACHSADKKMVGPSLKDIAKKYAGDKGAQAKLETKVRNGGSGSFSAMPMPPTAKTVSDADIKSMVTWILEQK